MVVLENGLLLDGVLYAVLDLIRRLFRFEVHQTSGLLLRQHTGNLGRAVPGKAKLVNLLHHRGGFLVYNKILVLVHHIAVNRLAGNRLAAHAFCSFYCFDFLARISHQPFVEQISQRGKIVVHAAVCAVHIVVDSDKTHSLLREQHFRVKPYLQVVSP